MLKKLFVAATAVFFVAAVQAKTVQLEPPTPKGKHVVALKITVPYHDHEKKSWRNDGGLPNLSVTIESTKDGKLAYTSSANSYWTVAKQCKQTLSCYVEVEIFSDKYGISFTDSRGNGSLRTMGTLRGCEQSDPICEGGGFRVEIQK